MSQARRPSRAVALLAATALGATGLVAVAAAPAHAAPVTEVFTYTGSADSYTVPVDGPTRVKITTVAGGGGSGSGAATSGAGAVVTTVQSATPGDVFAVGVGAGGTSGNKSGGSASVVQKNGTTIAVAGGGGGANGSHNMVAGSGAGDGTAAGSAPTLGACPGNIARAGASADGSGNGGAGGNNSSDSGAGVGGTSGSPNGGVGTSFGGGGGGYAGTSSGGDGGASSFSDPGGLSAGFSAPAASGAGGGGSGAVAGGGGGAVGGGGGYGAGGGSGACPAGGAGGSYAATAASGTTNTFEPGPFTYQGTPYGGGGALVDGGNGIVIIEAAADLSASPDPLAFGNQEVGVASSSSAVTVTNNGQQAANFTSIGTPSSEFVVAGTGTCVVGTPLAAAATCTVDVTFTPAFAGARVSFLAIRSDDPDSPLTVDLSGTGITYTASASPASVDFGNQPVSTPSAPAAVTFTNTGTESLTFGTLGITGNFAILFDNCSGQTVAAAATCTVNITFTPASAGSKTGDLTATSAAPDVVVPLAGVGTIPGFSASPDPLAFGNQVVGDPSPAEVVTVTNTGGAPLVFGAGAVVSSNPEFVISADNCSSQTIAAAGTCTVSVIFTATGMGAATGDLDFTNNATGSPFTVVMTATGVNPPGVPGQSTAVQSGPGAVTVTVTPPSTGGPVTTYKVTATPGGATCEVAAEASPLSCTITGLAAGNSYTFTAQAITGSDTSAPSPPSSAVTITSDNPGKAPWVTIEAGKVKGAGKKKKVNLSGETRKGSPKVYIYRANGKKKPAVLVAVRKASKKQWRAKNVSLGGRSSAFFCARVGTHFSDPIRVPSRATGRTITFGSTVRVLPGTTIRGDQVFCS